MGELVVYGQRYREEVGRKEPSGHISFLWLPLALHSGLLLTWESSSAFFLVACFHVPTLFLPVYLFCQGRAASLL